MPLRFVGLIGLAICACFGCRTDTPRDKRVGDSMEHTAGRELAQRHCAACHLYTGPEMLDRSSWVRVLSSMENEMEKADYTLEQEDWYAVQRFYLNNAPLTLGRPGPPSLERAGLTFRRSNLADSNLLAGPRATLLRYDANRRMLITGEIDGTVSILPENSPSMRVQIDNIPVDARYGPAPGELDILGMGSFYPSEAPTGAVIHIAGDGAQQVRIDSLKRPVHFQRTDLDGDGVPEYLISSFGSTTGEVNSGKLSLFTANGTEYEEKVLLQLPGAIRTQTADLDRDGEMDIVGLFAQGREVLMLFTNQGGLEFEQTLLLEFPPLYGTNSFMLADMNGDDNLDIVVTNGDNGDSSPIFKFYHGVRVFVNDGSGGFAEEYFFHLNGASRVVVEDFDHDGDRDMVILSMYPDLFSRPWESLVYFENDGKLGFEPAYLESEASAQWLLMEAGDIDGDGDVDLITASNRLINALFPPALEAKWDSSRVSIGYFENITR